MFQIFKTRVFWKNLLFAVIALFLLLFLFFQALDWLTNHGETTKVPNVRLKSVSEATRILEAQGFKVRVQDTVYSDTLPLLAVVKQLPAANEVVKTNRIIFLTVNRAKPPSVIVPDLLGQTYKIVEMKLRALNLEIGDTSYRIDFAKGSILEQNYKGQPLVPGTSLPYGSKIDLVIGAGLKQKDFKVPYLVGMGYRQARNRLDSLGIIIGAIVADGEITDSSAAIVYKQNPFVSDDDGLPLRIREGQLMDVWISESTQKKDSVKKVNSRKKGRKKSDE